MTRTASAPKGDCVIAKTEQFLTVLKDPKADKTATAQALTFVIHFAGDLHDPLHVEDNGDKGGNMRHVIIDGYHNNLHSVWDASLLQLLPRYRLPAQIRMKLTGLRRFSNCSSVTRACG